MNQIKSAFLRIDRKDVRRGIGLAIGATSTYFFGSMCTGALVDRTLLLQTCSVFIGTLGTYITKNFFTNSQDEFLKKEVIN